MKSTSKKSSGLLGGFDFQPIFSEQTLSQSKPNEKKKAKQSRTKPNEPRLSSVKPQTAMHSLMKHS